MSETTPQTNSFTDKKNIMWVLLSGAMAILFVALLFIPGATSPDSTLSIYAAMLWCGIFSATVFRYLGKNGWTGFAAGSAAGFCIQLLSAFVTV